MTMRTVALLAVTLTVLVAGCTGAPAGTDTLTTTDGSPAASDGAVNGDGQVNFYLSDEENAIGDFRHLNVTVSKVGFHRGGESGEWIERDVDGATVDLTELQGERATRVDSYDLPNGTYTKVFVYVDEVNATLTTGEQVRVKLPSEKLQLNQPFTLDGSGEVDFVFDISVHEAGNSGKYILKPTVGESGTDVPIEEVDDREDGDDEEATDLNATFVGDVTRGEDATVEVTRNGTAVEDATVTVNGDEVGTTDAAGRLTFEVPADAEELTVEVADGDDEVELEVEFEDERDETETEDGDEQDQQAGTPTPTATGTDTPAE